MSDKFYTKQWIPVHSCYTFCCKLLLLFCLISSLQPLLMYFFVSNLLNLFLSNIFSIYWDEKYNYSYKIKSSACRILCQFPSFRWTQKYKFHLYQIWINRFIYVFYKSFQPAHWSPLSATKHKWKKLWKFLAPAFAGMNHRDSETRNNINLQNHGYPAHYSVNIR